MQIEFWDCDRSERVIFVGTSLEDINQTILAHCVCRMRNDKQLRKEFESAEHFRDSLFTVARPIGEDHG
jgi:hypothetical protein